MISRNLSLRGWCGQLCTKIIRNSHFWSALALCLMSPGATAHTEVPTSSESEVLPRLDTTPPIRQLGSSEFRLTENDGNERPFCFSPEGTLIAGANGDELRLWSFPEGKLLHDFSAAVDSHCIAFSADGNYLLALQARKRDINGNVSKLMIYRFDVKSGRFMGRTTVGDVGKKEQAKTRYWLSVDGRWLCRTPALTVWNTSNGEPQLFKKLDRVWPRQARVSRNGVLTVWGNSFLECLDVTSGEQLSRSKLYERLQSPITNSEGTLMAAYSYEEKAIVFWNPLTDERVGGTIPEREREWHPEQAALSADGRRFVYRIEDGKYPYDPKVAVYDVETGNVISEFEPPDLTTIEEPVISPDGKFIFHSGDRRCISAH